MPHVRVLSTGGTIASTDGPNGTTPSQDGDDLIAAVPELEEIASVDVESVCDELSFHLSFSQITSLVHAVERAAYDDVDGVVVTHGTDTMEESAYYLDLVSDADVPIVFTPCVGSLAVYGEEDLTRSFMVTVARSCVHRDCSLNKRSVSFQVRSSLPVSCRTRVHLNAHLKCLMTICRLRKRACSLSRRYLPEQFGLLPTPSTRFVSKQLILGERARLTPSGTVMRSSRMQPNEGWPEQRPCSRRQVYPPITTRFVGEVRCSRRGDCVVK